jgi:hypothetical protein
VGEADALADAVELAITGVKVWSPVEFAGSPQAIVPATNTENISQITAHRCLLPMALLYSLTGRSPKGMTVRIVFPVVVWGTRPGINPVIVPNLLRIEHPVSSACTRWFSRGVLFLIFGSIDCIHWSPTEFTNFGTVTQFNDPHVYMDFNVYNYPHA